MPPEHPSGPGKQPLRCAACRRRLRNPSPTGLGPICARRLGTTTQPPARASPRGAPPEIPGQLTIPIQPTLPAA